MQDVAAIILAAGKGTRMKSERAKVLHKIAGVPMIQYVTETAMAIFQEIVVVIGHQADAVRNALEHYPTLRFAVQREQLGTGHAVMIGLPEIPVQTLDVVVLCGDTPLIRPETLRRLIDTHKATGGNVTLLVTELEEPFGYGRVVSDVHGNVVRIVEESDATDAEKEIRKVNTGTYCINVDFLKRSLPHLENDNVQSEFYLTDVVEAACRNGRAACLVEVRDTLQVMGVNSRDELVKVERFVQETLRPGEPKSS